MKKLSLLIFIILLSKQLYATEWLDSLVFTPTLATQAVWVFMGKVVSDESGESYNYVFKMHRDGSNFDVLVIIFNAQTHEKLLVEESSAVIEHPESLNWNIGNVF